MPEIDPVRLDAIDAVIEEKSERSEWDPDSMRSALLEVSRGKNQQPAADERDFDQPTLSKVLQAVREREEELRRMQEGSGIFRDAVDEAKTAFMDFFEDLDERYKFGFNDRAIQMLADELETSEQFPHPLRVREHLKGTKSGVSGTEVDYIVGRYRNWVEKNQESIGGAGGHAMGVEYAQNPGGELGNRSGGQPQQNSGGIPIENPAVNLTNPGGRGRQSPGQSVGNQQGKSPEVESLRREVRELKEAVVREGRGQSGGQKIKVEAENGRMMEMTIDQAEKAGFLDSGDGDDDLLETVRTLKELGVVGDDSGSEMASEIGQAIEAMGERQMQAQQQIAQSFQGAIDQMKEMEDDDDNDLSPDDIRSIINEEMKEDEIDRLESKLESMQSEFASELREAKKSNSSVMDDPEMFKTDREMELRREQLQTLNENAQELPTRFAALLRKGVIPMMEQMSDQNVGSQLWSPPEHSAPGGQLRSGQPPMQQQHQEQERNDAAGSRKPDRRPQEPRSPVRQQQQAEEATAGSVEPDGQESQSQESQTSGSGSGDVSEKADDVYEKLGIGGGSERTEDN